MATLSVVIVFTVLITVLNNIAIVDCHEPAASTDEERKPSMFKVGDEWLALPEVYSNLDFDADNTPASEEDIEGQLRLRSTRYWGR